MFTKWWNLTKFAKDVIVVIVINLILGLLPKIICKDIINIFTGNFILKIGENMSYQPQFKVKANI